MCAATGSLVSVKIMRNKSTQISLGYGFLEFSSHDAANTVLATYNGKSMPGTNNVFRCEWQARWIECSRFCDLCCGHWSLLNLCLCRLNWAAFGVGKPVDGEIFPYFKYKEPVGGPFGFYPKYQGALSIHDDAGVDFSCFVGDLAPDVTDYVLQEHFRAQYPSVRSAKVW